MVTHRNSLDMMNVCSTGVHYTFNVRTVVFSEISLDLQCPSTKGQCVEHAKGLVYNYGEGEGGNGKIAPPLKTGLHFLEGKHLGSVSYL